VRLYANYATGFKAPEPGQVNQFFGNLAFGYISEPNPDLGPERSESWEGGVRFGDGPVSASLTAFKANYKDFISQEVVSGSFTPTDPAIYQFINVGRVAVKGIEGKAEARLANGITARVAFAYADGDEILPDDSRTPLGSVDPFSVVAGIGYRDPAGRFGGEVIATHNARKSLASTAGVCTDACFRPGAFTIIDATAFVRLADRLTLRAGVFNITDEKYAYWSDIRGLAADSAVADAYTRPGRNASASLSFRF
jgi:hemoglobin/transferrin/lactoferrin receptor protein